MLRIHCLQVLCRLNDPAMEAELRERPAYRRFVGLEGVTYKVDEATFLQSRRVPETHELAPQVLGMVNASLAQVFLRCRSAQTLSDWF